MPSSKYLPYDRIVSNDGIVFEVQSGNSPDEHFVIGRPKFFAKELFAPSLGSVYWCDQDWFKIPLSPQLYPQSNRLIRAINPTYCIQTLEDISVLEYYSIPIENIVGHFIPVNSPSELPTKQCKTNRDAREMLELLRSEGLGNVIGIGGSIMMGLSGDYSDIDLEVYGAENLDAVVDSLLAHKKVTPRSIEELERRYEAFNEQFKSWISLEEYIFMEKRKINRGYFNGTKLTINTVDKVNHPKIPTERFEHNVNIIGVVTDDHHTFTHPASFGVRSIYSERAPTAHEVAVTSLSRIFIDPTKLGETCEIRGYLNAGKDKLIVHHLYGGIKCVILYLSEATI
ncbi:MAG: hypothetical protein AB1668_05495 [Nanoarchaeota archaeon]